VTAAEAVAHLRRRIVARDTDVPSDVGEAAAILIDHIARCEQALELVETGVSSALRHAPPRGVIGVKPRKGKT
jgi:hypothetical protein